MPIPPAILLGALLSLLAPAATVRADDVNPMRIAVVRFDVRGVPDDLGALVSDLVMGSIDRPGITLVERSLVNRVMEERRYREIVEGRPGQSRETGQEVHADYLLGGTIYKLGETYTVSARLVQVPSEAVPFDSIQQAQFSRIDELQPRIRELVRRMGLRKDSERASSTQAAPIQQGGSPPIVEELSHAIELREVQTVQGVLERSGGQTEGVTLRLPGDERVLREGDTLSIEVDSDRDGYLALIVVDALHRPALLLPNAAAPEAMVRKGKPLRVPGDFGFTLRLAPPTGVTRIKAIVTDRPMRLPRVGAGAGSVVQVGLQELLDDSGATRISGNWASSEIEFLVAGKDGATPARAPEPAPAAPSAPPEPSSPRVPPVDPATPPAPDPSSAARLETGPPEARIDAAMLDLQRAVRPRMARACEVLRWPLQRPAGWPETWKVPSIGWTPLPAELRPPRIAVIDADFDPDDPVLQRAFGRVELATRAALRDEARLQEDPQFRHGNRVASLIAGEASWLPSVLPGAEIVPYRVTALPRAAGSEWRIDRGDERQVLQALRQAADAGCRVINLSLSLGRTASVASDPVWDELQRRGVLVVCAAGNHQEDLDAPDAPYPAALGRPNILCVGAVGLDGELALWPGGGSAKGARTVHLLAPGCRLAVSDGGGEPELADNGTSYAAPLAAGTAAAWMALHPSWTPERVIEAMVAASRPTDATGKACRGGLLQWPDTAVRESAAGG